MFLLVVLSYPEPMTTTKRRRTDEAFPGIACRILKEKSNALKWDIINEAAFEMEVSPATTARYLAKYASHNGPLRLIRGVYVRCNCGSHASDETYDSL